MKKIAGKVAGLFASLCFVALASTSVQAAANKTVENKGVESIPQQCKKFFNETENLIAEAEKQPGTHIQVNKIKSKLKQSKQHILEMELAAQIKSCDVGLAKLNNLKQQDDQ